MTGQVVTEENPPRAATNRWTATPDWIHALVVFVVALVLRLAHLGEIKENDPFFYHPSVDPLFYHEWAARIASGDWLGEGVFLHGPLYPYLLGALYSLTGPDLYLPRLLQSLLGAVSCLLVWILARELFGRREALVAGLLAAVYSMAIFYEGSLLIVNVLSPLIMLLLWISIGAAKQPSLVRWLGVGVLTGIATLARPNLLLYLPFALGWCAWVTRDQATFPRRLAMLMLICTGFALCVLPSAVRNHAVTGDWVMVSASGGMNFFNGNNPDANAMHNVPGIFDRSQADHPEKQNKIYANYARLMMNRDLKPSEVSSYWLSRGLRYVANEPIGWLRLEVKKAMLFVNAFEVWNNRNITLSRQFSWVLQLPLLTFGVMAPFAIVGLFLSAGLWRRLLPLYALLSVQLITALTFFVLSRYRLPIVPILTIFGAYTLVHIFDDARARRTGRVATSMASLAACAVLVHWPVVPSDDLSGAHYNLGNKYYALEQYDRAIEEYRASIEIDPTYIPVYKNLAIALDVGRRPKESIRMWEHVLELARQRGLTDQARVATESLRFLRSPEAPAQSGDDRPR